MAAIRQPISLADQFGIIEVDDEDPRRIGAFREKPKELEARGYVETGEYFWNSGIFVWKAATVLKALEVHKPQLHAAVGRGVAKVNIATELEDAFLEGAAQADVGRARSASDLFDPAYACVEDEPRNVSPPPSVLWFTALLMPATSMPSTPVKGPPFELNVTLPGIAPA